MSVLPANNIITDSLNLVKAGTPYLALYTNGPTAADTGTEVSGGSYARQAITFGAITAGAIKNTAVITFTGLNTASITHYGVKSALTAGTLRIYGTLDSAAAVVTGDQVQFPISSITVNLSGS